MLKKIQGRFPLDIKITKLSRCEGSLQWTLEKKRNGLIQEHKHGNKISIKPKGNKEKESIKMERQGMEKCEKHATTRLGKKP